jgi:DNA-binding transcriptional MerR regulator
LCYDDIRGEAMEALKIEKLTIGQMARINHISEQTLRLYDRMDILKPSSINVQTGYRYYSIRQCARLDMIQYMIK